MASHDTNNQSEKPSVLPPIGNSNPVDGSIYQANRINQQTTEPSYFVHATYPNPNPPPVYPSAFMVVNTGPVFEHRLPCRSLAIVMLIYYGSTIIFVQPFVTGVAGIITGFVGYHGCRQPVDALRAKWVRAFVWLNYLMIAINVVILALNFFMTSTLFGVAENNNDSGSSSDSDSGVHGYLLGGSAYIIFVVVLVLVNVMLHFKGVQNAKRYHAELQRTVVDGNVDQNAVVGTEAVA